MIFSQCDKTQMMEKVVNTLHLDLVKSIYRNKEQMIIGNVYGSLDSIRDLVLYKFRGFSFGAKCEWEKTVRINESRIIGMT